MTVFLEVLKIAGFVLAGVVGFALLVAILALVVPVFYKLKIQGRNKDIEACFTAKWLLGLVYAKAALEGKKFSYIVKIAGIKVSSGAPEGGTAEAGKAAPGKIFQGKDRNGEKKAASDKKHADRKPLSERITETGRKVKAIWEKVKTARYILGAPVTRRAWTFVKKILLKVLRSILPKKMQGRLEFGTGDPAVTAQVYGIANAVVNSLDDRLMLVPNMEEKIVDADFSINGRIIAGFVLICMLRIIRNRDVRRVISYTRRNL